MAPAAAQAAAQQHVADLAGADGHAFLTREEAVAMRQSLAPQAQVPPCPPRCPPLPHPRPLWLWRIVGRTSTSQQRTGSHAL